MNKIIVFLYGIYSRYFGYEIIKACCYWWSIKTCKKNTVRRDRLIYVRRSIAAGIHSAPATRGEWNSEDFFAGLPALKKLHLYILPLPTSYAKNNVCWGANGKGKNNFYHQGGINTACVWKWDPDFLIKNLEKEGKVVKFR